MSLGNPQKILFLKSFLRFFCSLCTILIFSHLILKFFYYKQSTKRKEIIGNQLQFTKEVTAKRGIHSRTYYLCLASKRHISDPFPSSQRIREDTMKIVAGERASKSNQRIILELTELSVFRLRLK